MMESKPLTSGYVAIVSDKASLDVSKIFLAYLSAGGDALTAARIAEVSLDDVLHLARTEMWDAKMDRQGLTPGKNESFEERARQLNRMACYVQALRIRGLIDETIRHLYENGAEALESFCSEKRKDGSTYFSTKPLMELTKAAETAHNMLFRALGDVVVKDAPGDSFKNVRELHMTVVNQLQAAGGGQDLRVVEPVIRETEKKTDVSPTNVATFLDA